MIYTTYFAKLKKLPDSVAPVAISLMQPKGVDIKTCYSLTPPPTVLWDYKKDGDECKYINNYKTMVLDKLKVKDIVEYLYILANGKDDVALVCYESSEKFCHRHIVADWLKENGYPCEEYNFDK